MAMTTGDLYRLASDLAAEHGKQASEYASRAVDDPGSGRRA